MKKSLYILLGLLTMVGCIRKTIYNTPHPLDGTLLLTTVWEQLHTGDVAPTEYRILQDNQDLTYVDLTNTFYVEPNQDNLFLVYNETEGIEVSGGIAALKQRTGAAMPEHNPANLYYAMKQINVPQDQVTAIEMQTRRANAPLTITLSYVGSDLTNVDHFTVALSGVASKRNLLTDALMEETTLTTSPPISASSSELVLEYNLFGIIAVAPKLTITQVLISGETRVIESDLSQALLNFNSAMEPLALSGDLNLPADIEADGSISDWTIDDRGGVTIN